MSRRRGIERCSGEYSTKRRGSIEGNEYNIAWTGGGGLHAGLDIAATSEAMAPVTGGVDDCWETWASVAIVRDDGAAKHRFFIQLILIHSMACLKDMAWTYHHAPRPLEKAIGAAREPPQRPKCSTAGHRERPSAAETDLTGCSRDSRERKWQQQCCKS